MMKEIRIWFLILMVQIVFLIDEFFHLSCTILLESLFFLFRIITCERVLTVKNGLVLIGTVMTIIIILFGYELFVTKRLSITIKMLLSVLRVLVIILVRIFSSIHTWLFSYIDHFFVFIAFSLIFLKIDKMWSCHKKEDMYEYKP